MAHLEEAAERPGGLSTRRARLVEPAASGLPNWRVLAWFPGVVSLYVLVMTLLGVTGSSSGRWYPDSGFLGKDPDLIAGTPRTIRVDEYRVQASWIISQFSQGFPRYNHVLPGGMDATIMNDVPVWDWSTAFRPHLWGFLAVGLDHGMAWRWWVPVALMVVAIYLFVVSLLPRHPLLGATLALAVVFQPLTQWIWLPIVPEPVTFGFAAMTAAVWGFRSTSRVGRWLPAALAGYLAVDVVMTIYVPFLVPAVLVAAAFVLGFALQERQRRALALKPLLLALAPLAVAGAGAGVVLAAWVATRRATVSALLGTVYPGQRSTPPGAATHQDLVTFLAAPFQRALMGDGSDYVGLARDPTDGASVLLLAAFLLIPLAAVLVLRRRGGHGFDWLVASTIAVQVVSLAWMFLPGWGLLARVLLLNRTLVPRMWLAFAMLAVVAVVVLVQRLEELDVRLPWRVTLPAAVVVLLPTVYVWGDLRRRGSPAVPSASAVVITLLMAVAVLALARRRALLGGVVFLVGSLALGATVNPLYHGLFDLRKTESGQAVLKIEQHHPDATWVGIGMVSNFTLVETGVTAFNGVQTYPTTTMWHEIDPTGADKDVWNRLAGITWAPGSGPPHPRLAARHVPDQIALTFDSCSEFAQKYVDYVMVDALPVEQPCLTLVKAKTEGTMSYRIYRVVPPS